MGWAYGRLEDYNNSISAYKKAVEINPRYEKAYFGMSLAYWALGNYDAAITNINKAIEINPSDSDYQEMLQDLIKYRH